MSIEAMKLALEALENVRSYDKGNLYGLDENITDLCTAIEQAEKQEPYGYVSIGNSPVFRKEKPEIGRWKTVYTTPPAAQRTWVGLTDEDKAMCIQATIERGSADELIAAIEAKLKEKQKDQS
jgi:hypothetical protein